MAAVFLVCGLIALAAGSLGQIPVIAGLGGAALILGFVLMVRDAA